MLKWSADLSVGYGEIDAQHQEIFRHAEASDAALEGAVSAAQVKTEIDFLVSYCESHLNYEARLMGRAGYPGAKEHLEQHTSFVHEVRGKQRELVSGTDPTAVAMDLNELVLGWLVKHIASYDRALGEWLRQHPEVKPG